MAQLSSKTEPLINEADLSVERREYLFALPDFVESWFLEMLIDKRDIVMIRLMLNVTLVMIPAAALLFWWGSFHPLVGLAYVVINYALFIQRYVLTLHFSSHRKLFAKNNILNQYPAYILAPLFGLPSGSYYFHHVIMHHVENNVFPYDVSSTMHYQRDNFLHFLHYWLRYVIAIWVQLPYYLFKRSRYGMLAQCITSQAFYFVLLAALWRVSGQATFWVLIAPYLASSFLLMFGNWSQHIFVNPKNHTDSYNLTYNIINTDMNKLTYNDGYHIAHHESSRLHWSELPLWFNRNINKLADKGSLTFCKVDYVAIGFMCMTGQLEKLAGYYVNIGPSHTHRSKAQVVETMREWFKPVPY